MVIMYKGEKISAFIWPQVIDELIDLDGRMFFSPSIEHVHVQSFVRVFGMCPIVYTQDRSKCTILYFLQYVSILCRSA